MKVALTVWEKRISPVFDCAQRLLIVDVVGHRETDRHFEPFQDETPFSRAEKLSHLGVQVLICGAVSDHFASIIESYGIRIISFITGAVDEVLDSYLMDGVCDSKFRMPGCRTGRDEGFRGEH